MTLKGRSFLTLLDFTPKEIEYLLDLAADFKDKKKNGVPHDIHRGKNIALIFEKTSTRTRCAFEVAAADLGINAVYLDPSASQLGKKESIADTARVLGRMFDGIEYRGFGQERVKELAKYSGVPVWNGLTNEFHPTQILADFLTVREHFGSLAGRKMVYMGDARYNMCNSLMVGSAKMGLQFTVCSPKQYFPDKKLIDTCKTVAEKTGASINFETDPNIAVAGADVIYTDVWVSMGESEKVWEKRIKDLYPYQVNEKIIKTAGKQCRFMHCLPAFHDKLTEIGADICTKFGLDCLEVTDEVFESEQSIVFDEAENRLHTIKAVIAATLPGLHN
ncbi:MAG: ornithine carbamoyltransferase [Clostridia bacterium]|nr:ornithine carbamoyltransferase [Clostridia bacterium]